MTFFATGDFSTVYIASPNSLHYEQAVLAINAGKNVIIEKPAFENQAQMEKNSRAAQAASRGPLF